MIEGAGEKKYTSGRDVRRGPTRGSERDLLRVLSARELLDWTGRQVRADKRGAIQSCLAPILECLQINADAH